jgi:phosphoribosylformylglycinamidine synthase II
MLTLELSDLLSQLNLTRAEYDRIVSHLGREPNFNELSMFSVLWSEHCCYKNSKHLLKTLPTQGPRIVHGPGENAGVIDAGDGLEVAFKIESHNHPTAVEPYQGAATGVGGILRDIFTMNARPVANLNSLRFGPQNDTRNHYLFTHAVKGIGDYGNCVGVPTVAGEVFFDAFYSGNPLVNAMAIGILQGPVMTSAARGVGNPVLYVGSETGKDGMGGAAFASRELDEKSSDDRPAVQVGDPFAEKLLIEACLEAFKTGLVVAAQDMGAAGLTSSSCEMAAKGGVGMTMDLDKVPAREPGMKPYEYLLSESQERMLMVLEKGKEQPVLDIFEKWQIPAVVIGEVTDTGRVEVFHHGEKVVDLPAALLTDLAPNYDPGIVPEEPEVARQRRQQPVSLTVYPPLKEALTTLLASDNIARPWNVFSQYDRHVQNNTVLASEHQGGGVFRLRHPKDNRHTGLALAVTTDCNPRYVYLAPQRGAATAVAEAARNLVAVGADPVAVTDNLNFGNPEKPEIYYQLYWAVAGIRDACTVLETPVTGGNVSLYNEFQGQAIFPTPVIGMVGLVPDDTRVMTPRLQPGRVALVGRFDPTLAGSEYQALFVGPAAGEPPSLDLTVEKRLNALLLKLMRETEQVKALQDVSLGGVLVTLTEQLLLSQRGFALNWPQANDPVQAFGESNGSYLLNYSADDEAALRQVFEGEGFAFTLLGETLDAFELRLPEQPAIALTELDAAWRRLELR